MWSAYPPQPIVSRMPVSVRAARAAIAAPCSAAGEGEGPRLMLELRDVARSYGQIVALDGLSLAVPEGEVVGFVGPNGAGKTTAKRIALGILEPDAGEVRWRGEPVTREQQRLFGYMPEERGLYPKMRVDRHLRYLAALHGRDRSQAAAAATRWIERLGLAERAGQRVEELSLGNQQRVQLAAALVHEPELLVLDEPFSGLDPLGVDVLSGVLLVLDEPFSGLDPVGVDVLSGVLLDYARTGVPVVFSSHQLELVERLCEAVAIIKDGRLVASGTVEELRGPGKKVVKEVIERPTLTDLFREAVK